MKPIKHEKDKRSLQNKIQKLTELFWNRNAISFLLLLKKLLIFHNHYFSVQTFASQACRLTSFLSTLVLYLERPATENLLGVSRSDVPSFRVKERTVGNKRNLPVILHANKLLCLYSTSRSLSKENPQE